MSELSDYEFIQLERDDGVVILTLNRPEVLNACNPATHREVQRAIDEVEVDPDAHVLILRGAGRAFCSGSDLREVGKMEGAEAKRYIRLDFSTKNRIASCSKPVIGALHGHVAGGGFEMALACDMRFVAEDVQFSLPEIILGTIPGSGGLQRLPQIVGLGIAKEWAMTGRRIGAQEAHLRGLANAVHPNDALMAETIAFAKSLAERSALALSLAKVALDPVPPAVDGMVGAYHRLASQACHDDPVYKSQASGYTGKR
ncbi:MAG: enoyl-CoA hydratase/isomerase family protein [Hyphomicrobiales bacterium]